MDFLTCFGTVAGLIAFVIAIAIYAQYLERKRTEAMARVAEELAFEFCPKGDSQLSQHLSGFQLFNQGHSRRMTNLLRGRTSELELCIFDYRFTTGSGKNQKQWLYTVFVARRPGLNLPQFSLSPENFLHKIGSLFGFKDIDFESHQLFSSRYLLRGADEDAIRELFQPHVLDWFEQHPGLTLEAEGDTIVLARRPNVSPEKVRDLMNEGFEILKVLESARAG